jgi:predicted PurR-regulated permease PerM
MNNYKKYWPIAIMAFLFYLAVHYWNSLINLTGTIFHASTSLIFGFILAYIVNLLMVQYERGYDYLLKGQLKKPKRGICILLSYITVIVAFSIIIAIVAPQVVNAVTILVKDGGKALMPYLKKLDHNPAFSQYAKHLETLINGKMDVSSVAGNILQTFFSGASSALSAITGALSSFFSLIATLLFGIMFSLYLLAGKEKLIRGTKRVINTYCPRGSEKILYVAHVFNDAYRQFIIGQVMEAVIIGVLCFIGGLILQLPYAAMVGTIVGVTALIPIAGCYIGAGLSAFLIFTVSPIKALEFLIFIFVLQQLEDNLIYTRVVGSSLGLPGIFVLAAITIFGGVFGFAGMLCGVPMTSAIYRLVQNDMRKKNG